MSAANSNIIKSISNVIFNLVLLLCISKAYAQGGWTWQKLPNMPMKISNNAVSPAMVNDTPYVYSFFGIDTTKAYDGINSKAFRYNTISQIWDTIPDVPDSLGGLIAAGASTIENKIYIIGGYHVYASGNEISSYEVYIFDPMSNTYSRGQNIPIEIDDHVQLTYKDSLIYVVSGWTSSLGGGNNTNAVQVYDVANDQWYAANDMPSTSTFEVFGASGTIHNDTLYFAGGARYGFNFPLVATLRKGVINPTNPLDITWYVDTVINNFKPYRSACIKVNDKTFWLGGSSTSYNYDAMAYNGTGGVNPNTFITEHNNTTNKWAQYSSTSYDIMDIRGFAKISETGFILCGGMESGQKVSNSTYLITYDTSFSSPTDSIAFVEDSIQDTTTTQDTLLITRHLKVDIVKKSPYIYVVENVIPLRIELIDVFGRIQKLIKGTNTIDILGANGVCFIRVILNDGSQVVKAVLID